eukprot:GEMP01008425.1.p1 GENE.GEMP01008425.1~~GEMP01008425.1.p1  ORF type:complete len:547 (+),score=123.63 GEMP01008425.1:3-1643(+)
MFVIGFKVSYKRFAIIADEIKAQAVTAQHVDFTEPNPPPRLLGTCLHAPPLNQFLCTNLNIPTERAKSRSVIAPESQHVRNDTLVALALAHLAAGISTRCGRRALQESPEYATAMPQWLDSMHRSAAISCVLAMADIEELHTEMRTHVLPALLAAWQLVYDARHTSCAKSIVKIRGMDKIIVSFGPIREIRRIAIPRRTVWLVPYTPTVTNEDPIDAVLTFPPEWDLPPGYITPINVPHLCIPTARNRALGVRLTVNRTFGSVRNMVRRLSQFSALRRSVVSRTSALRRLTTSGDFPMCPNAAVLPMAWHNETGVPPTPTQSRWGALLAVRGNEEDAPSATLKDGSATSLAMSGGSAADSGAQQDWEGGAWVMAEVGEEGSRSVVGQGKGRETLVAEEGGEPAHSGARQGVEGEVWVAGEGDDGTSSIAQDDVSALPVSRRSVTGRLSVPQRSQKWSTVLRRTRSWGHSMILRNKELETRRKHILFSLLDCDLVTDEDDGVPTHQLRQALTAFYAFKVMPRDWNDEDDSVDSGEEAGKNRNEKEDT